MLFNSLRFMILFMPVVLLGARLLRGRPFLVWICLVSAVFYAYAGHAWFLVPMAITTVLDFCVGRQLMRVEGTGRKLLLGLSLGCNLALLGYFKYSGLIADSAMALSAALGLPHASTAEAAVRVVLPAGISFYTFQTMSFVIDIYRRENEPEPNFFTYLAFVAFFPHLVAGPLTRHNQLIPQLHRIEREGIQPRWWPAISLFSIGLIKKVLIADRAGNLVDLLLGDMSRLGVITAWLCAVGYAVQIYYDFSGYSDMAIGLGRMFGVELPQNFNSPYQSLNPSDFWRRWHITLSQWLRDYFYISLGGNRRGRVRVKFNLMVTMFLGGLWHGANWTFAAWGIYHGALLVLYQWRKKAWDSIHPSVQRALMFLLVCLGWVFFRSANLHDALVWTGAMGGAQGLAGQGLYIQPVRSLSLATVAERLAVLCFVAVAIAMFAPNAYQIEPARISRRWRVVLGAVAAIAVVMMNFSSKFLYFQF
jgi:alginate O-acetyltransferase complex protein AlgI